MQHERLLALLVLAALITAAPAAHSGKLYKWTDAQGRVHYSDVFPPDAAARGREVKSERGITLDHVEAAKSRERLEAERAATKREEARRRAEEEAARQQAAADRALLLTFSSTAELERARDDRVAAVDGQISVTRERMERLQSQLRKALEHAADAERTGHGATQNMHDRIRDMERQIADHQAFIEERERERAAIIAKFNADLARYQELKSAQAR
jgi:hypothetical protein